MEITITDIAAEKMSEKTKGRDGFFKLKYDIEGCGCAVDGIIALWFVPQLDEDDILIETDHKPIYIEKSKRVFFDEEMNIDYSITANCFILKSPQQILNGHMSLVIAGEADCLI